MSLPGGYIIICHAIGNTSELIKGRICLLISGYYTPGRTIHYFDHCIPSVMMVDGFSGVNIAEFAAVATGPCFPFLYSGRNGAVSRTYLHFCLFHYPCGLFPDWIRSIPAFLCRGNIQNLGDAIIDRIGLVPH